MRRLGGISAPGFVRRAAACALCLLAASFLTASASGDQPKSDDEVFRKLILDRIGAYGRGDVETYTRMLAPGFVHISDLGERRTRGEMRAYVGGHGDDGATYRIASLSWFLKGDLAVVDAEIGEHRPDMELAQHEMDIFVARGARWLYLRHEETARWKQPVAVVVPGERLDDYAGRYRTTSGTIDIISVSHGMLLDRTLPSNVPLPFVHVARGAVGFAGDPTLAVFLRDPAGKVRQCLWHLPSCQTIVSARIE